MPQQRVLLGFTNAPDHSLEETAGAVIENLYGNAAFATPPVTKVALQPRSLLSPTPSPRRCRRHRCHRG